MEGKTIKQIADELGVSKDRVKYLVKKLPSEWVNKQGNITHLNSEAEQEIHILIGKKQGIPHEKVGNNKVNSPLIETLQTTIQTLQEQLVTKDNQIKSLQEQMFALQIELERERQHARDQSNKLVILVDQAQQLHAADKKATLLLESRENEQKLSFWKRLAAKKARKKSQVDDSES